MVTSDKASRGRPRECMTTADIVTGDPADDGTSDASLGENGCSGDGTGGQRDNQSDFAEHAVFLDGVCCKRNSPHHGCKSHAALNVHRLPWRGGLRIADRLSATSLWSVTLVYASRLRAQARLIADAVAILSGAINAQTISDQSMSDRN